MIVRSATLSDAAALAELGAETFSETFGHLYSAENLALHLSRAHSVAAHESALKDPDMHAWIAEDDAGRAVAYATAGRCKLPVENIEPDAGELKQIYVRAGYQGHQLGSKLMDAALGWLETHYGPLYIGVWTENTGAQRLYRRHGFESVAEYRFRFGEHYDRDLIFRRPAGWPASAGAG